VKQVAARSPGLSTPNAGTKSKASPCLDVRAARQLLRAARAAAGRGECLAAQFVALATLQRLAAATARVGARVRAGKKSCATDVARAASEAARAFSEIDCRSPPAPTERPERAASG
jgi:hypothetical protein